MSSSSGSEDQDFRFLAPLRILKEITLKVLVIGDYGVGGFRKCSILTI